VPLPTQVLALLVQVQSYLKNNKPTQTLPILNARNPYQRDLSAPHRTTFPPMLNSLPQMMMLALMA
jgi:hypothetical protein